MEAHYGPLTEQLGIRLPIDQGSVSGRVFLERHPVHVDDLSEAADFPLGRQIAIRFGVRTILAVPLLREAVPIGVILIRRTEIRPFSNKQIALLQTFADQAVIAIENVRLFKELEARNRDLTEALEQQTATSEILQVISRSPTEVQPVFETIVRNAVRLCGGVHGGVYRFDGQLVHSVAHDGYTPEELESWRKTWPRPVTAASAACQAIRTKRLVRIADIETAPELSDLSPEARANVRARGSRGLVGVPIRRQDDVIGAIAVTHGQIDGFSDAHLELLKTFADQAVIAIENVRLFTELEARNRDLTEALDQQTATSEILRVISSSPTDLGPVMDAVAENAARLCDASDAQILRADGETITLVASYGSLPTISREPRPISRRLVGGRAIIDRVTLHIPDVTLVQDEFPDSSTVPLGVRTALAIPLLREGTAIGVIMIRRMEVRPFSDKQVALLQTFANQAVIAIENVRLFKELEASNAELTESLAQQTATSEILRTIAHAQTDTQPVFDTIVRSAARLCHGANAALFLTHGGMLYEPANYGSSPEARAATRARYPRPVGMDTPPGMAILTRSVVHVPDTEDPSATEHVRQGARLLGFRGLVTVPMLREGAPVGAIIVTHRDPGLFSDAEVELLQTFADQAVIAIENVRLFKELEARNAELTDTLARQTATGEVLRAISRAQTDAQPVFDIIAESAQRLCGAGFGQVALYDGASLHMTAFHNVNPEGVEALRRRFPAPADRGSAMGRALETRAVVQIPDVLGDPTYAFKTELQTMGFQSLLVVPMLRKDEPIGAIAVGRLERGAFPDKQIELLQTFADQAVIAIENVRLFKELEARTAELTRSVGELTALSEISQVLSSTLDLGTVLTTIVSRAVELSGLDGGVVFEYDDGTAEFVHRAATETGGTLAEARRTTRVRRGEGMVGQTAITLEPAQVPDITEPGAYDSRLRGNLIESGVRAILAVPMVREGQLIGCLVVSRNRAGNFPAETVELLRTFGTQSALAIQNARLFHEIADKSRQLEAASQHKSEFLANMSHELRTPLNAIIGFSEVLAQGMFGEINEKQTEYLQDILESGRHLLSLINDILDLSKIEAGRMDLELSEFDLPQAIQNALTLVRERALRRGIDLHHAIDDRVAAIRSDERKVKQVLLNLLSNAIKFTPEGGRIEVRAASTDGMVEVSVTDTGVGIAPEDQDAVFEEFRQVGTADKKAEGTGLGLALSRKFIELHGGKIWVNSELGSGSTFTFTLPVRT
jgi:GAF domain-containing protein